MADKVKAPKAPKAKIVKAPKKPKASKPPKTPKAPGGRAETRENPGKGHNVAALRDIGVDFVARFLKLDEQEQSDAAGYRADKKNLYYEASNALGLKSTVVQKELKRILANKRAKEKEAEMEAAEREQTELWRSAMAGTQFQLFSEGDLASPETGDDADEGEGAEGEAGQVED